MELTVEEKKIIFNDMVTTLLYHTKEKNYTSNSDFDEEDSKRLDIIFKLDPELKILTNVMLQRIAGVNVEKEEK